MSKTTGSTRGQLAQKKHNGNRLSRSSTRAPQQQQQSTNNKINSATALTPVVDLICLSDSEENEKQQDVLFNNQEQSELGQQNPNSESPTNLSNQPNATSNPPNALEQYYLDRGLSLLQVLRWNRSYVRHDGPLSEARGKVFWDNFSPPPGFTLEDLPNMDNLPLSQPEKTVSPAILTAARYKLQQKKFVRKEPSPQEFQELLDRLTKRKATAVDKENSPQAIKKQNFEASSCPEATAVSANDSMNDSFPEMENDLNDSALVRCTQAVERQFQEVEATNATSIVDLVEGGRKKSYDGPVVSTSPSLKMNSSKAIFYNNMMETPRSAQATPRRSARNLHVGASASSTGSSWSNSSVFETSLVEESSAGRQNSRRNTPIHMPRKSLFPSPALCESPKTIGDFDEDDDDDLFSQIELPTDLKSESNAASNKKRM